MLWVKALHIIFIVTWFAGLFYLPRLYVYHAMSKDQMSIDRFIIMERKLYFGITTPSAILATVFGIWLLVDNWQFYIHANWMLIKLAFVLLLWIYHIYLGVLWKNFKKNKNQHGHGFYRWINEIPVLFLVVIVILVIVKPF
jgi:putative membrane protein